MINCILKQISKAPDCIIPAFYCAAVWVNTRIKGLDSSLTLLSVCSKTLTCAPQKYTEILKIQIFGFRFKKELCSICLKNIFEPLHKILL